MPLPCLNKRECRWLHEIWIPQLSCAIPHAVSVTANSAETQCDRNAQAHIDGLVQERRNSSALAMELRLSCTNVKSEGFLSVYREWRCLTFSSECHWHALRRGIVSDYMKYGSLSFHVPFHMQSVMSQRILWRQNVDEMLKHIQCSAIITWFIFSKVWTKDTP